MHSLEISRITSSLPFYSLLSVLISIFIIQFLTIESYGINNTSTKDIQVLDKIALDSTPQCIKYNPDNGNMYVPSQNGVYVINSSNNKISKIIPSNISIVEPILQINFKGCLEYNP